MLLTKCIDDDIPLVKGLKNEVQALKSRCNKLKKSVKDLQSICDMHRRSLETYQMHVVHLEDYQGTLDLSYQGEELELEL
jgi:archaellum component FlaC